MFRVVDGGTSRQVSSSAIISVSLFDSQGQEIPLVGEVELCFTSTSTNEVSRCNPTSADEWPLTKNVFPLLGSVLGIPQ